jgi:hypothetical protein
MIIDYYLYKYIINIPKEFKWDSLGCLNRKFGILSIQFIRMSISVFNVRES